jgi:hypothetical protein
MEIMNSPHQDCSNLFKGFHFQVLQKAEPPKQKGIYVIRVVERGEDPQAIITSINEVLGKIDWPLVSMKVENRLSRILKINDCPYIYIGAAGPNPKSKFTLLGRYKDFAGRHTIMFPTWALLYFGWKLEYGFLEGQDSGGLERSLKSKYVHDHGGKLPALVSR